jgi:broad-specificity NMP kinase
MTPRKRVIVITGVPGTGKTRISGLLAGRLKDAEVIHATELIRARGLFSSRDRDGTKVVRMKALERELGRIAEASRSRYVIMEGHILCDLGVRGADAVVLREHLGVLRKRLEARGYGREKTMANLVSEATDYCGANAGRHYRKVYEIFPGQRGALAELVRIAEGKRVAMREIDLLGELISIIKNGKDFVA